MALLASPAWRPELVEHAEPEAVNEHVAVGGLLQEAVAAPCRFQVEVRAAQADAVVAW